MGLCGVLVLALSDAAFVLVKILLMWKACCLNINLFGDVLGSCADTLVGYYMNRLCEDR